MTNAQLRSDIIAALLKHLEPVSNDPQKLELQMKSVVVVLASLLVKAVQDFDIGEEEFALKMRTIYRLASEMESGGKPINTAPPTRMQ